MSSKLYLLSFLSILFFSMCEKNEVEEMDKSMEVKNNKADRSEKKPLRYLALGDSYTKAECESAINSYPAQLKVAFEEEGYPVDELKLIAQTGWRTDNLANAIKQASLSADYDLVSLLIGVNDQYQGRPISEYKPNFIALLDSAIKYANGRADKVFVISIPDYGATPFGSGNAATIGQEIDAYNAINKQVSDSLGVQYFDITPISREAKTNTNLNCTDNLHPSRLMYERWVSLMLPTVLEMVAKP